MKVYVSSLHCFVITNRVFIQVSCDSAQGRFQQHTDIFRVCCFSSRSVAPAYTLPSPSCPWRRGSSGMGHCFAVGATASTRRWLLLHHCALLLLEDVCVWTHSQPQNRTKAVTEGKPMLRLPLWSSCSRKAWASRNNINISLLLVQPQAVFLFLLFLMLHLPTSLTACTQESGKTRPIFLSNQDFVLPQYRKSNLTHLQSFYWLYTLEAALRWGFSNPCSLHGTYGPVWRMRWVKERVQSQSWTRNIPGL